MCGEVVVVEVEEQPKVRRELHGAGAVVEFILRSRVIYVLSFFTLMVIYTNPRYVFPNRIGPDGLIKVNDFTQNPRVRLE